MTGGKLSPGQLSGSPTIAFHNPSCGQFDYDLIFLGRLNDPPEITTIPKIEAITGATYRYDVNAVDQNNDTLTYSLLQSPSGMEIDPASGLITWSTDTPNIGQHDVVVLVADGRGGTATQRYSMSVIIAPPNRPPVITSTPPSDATGISYSNTEPISYEGEWLYKVVAFDEVPGFEQPLFDDSQFSVGLGGFGSGGNGILNQTVRKTLWP